MLADLTGKIAVVTGGGQGIGRGIALVLARQGADVAIADITTDEPKSVACEIEAMGRKAVVLSMDVTDREQVEEAMSSAIDALGQVDILVNNAGIGGAGDWERTFAVNVVGVVNSCEAVLPHMKERRYGKIINIASMAGHAPRRLGGAYAASKAAVLRYTKGAAFELAPSNINVNAVCPGAIWTAFQQKFVVAAPTTHTRPSWSGMSIQSRWAARSPPRTWARPWPSSPLTTPATSPANACT